MTKNNLNHIIAAEGSGGNGWGEPNVFSSRTSGAPAALTSLTTVADGDSDQLARWQSSPEANCFFAIRDMDIALDNLVTLSQSREGVRFIRREAANIKSIVMRLHDLMLDLEPVLSVAE